MTMVLEIKGLCKQIKGRTILDSVNMEIPAKTVVGFIGPNGAGKTTTMRLCCGLSSITAGEVFSDGISIRKDFERYISQIGVSLSNNNFYYQYTAFENAKLFSSLMGVTDAQIKETIEMVGLANRIDSPVGTYSLGMKQRLSIALAILHCPKVVFLDEPFNGIDPMGIADMRRIISTICEENGTSFLISSHNLNEISKVTSQNYFINQGKIVRHDVSSEKLSFLDIKVDQPDKLMNIFETYNVTYYREGESFFFAAEHSAINPVFREIVGAGISILEITTGSYLEKRYIEMMGDERIE